MRQNPIRAKHGNRIEVMLDGAKVGAIQSVDMADDYSPEPVSGVGDIHVLEYPPSMARHTLQVEEMVLNRPKMRSLGVAVENGDDALNGLVFDFQSIDKETGELLRTYRGCSYASGHVSVRKHAVVVASATFMALDVSGSGA